MIDIIDYFLLLETFSSPGFSIISFPEFSPSQSFPGTYLFCHLLKIQFPPCSEFKHFLNSVFFFSSFTHLNTMSSGFIIAHSYASKLLTFLSPKFSSFLLWIINQLHNQRIFVSFSYYPKPINKSSVKWYSKMKLYLLSW